MIRLTWLERRRSWCSLWGKWWIMSSTTSWCFLKESPTVFSRPRTSTNSSSRNAQGADLVQGTPALWRSLVSAGWKGHEGEVPKGRYQKGYYGTEGCKELVSYYSSRSWCNLWWRKCKVPLDHRDAERLWEFILLMIFCWGIIPTSNLSFPDPSSMHFGLLCLPRGMSISSISNLMPQVARQFEELNIRKKMF